MSKLGLTSKLLYVFNLLFLYIVPHLQKCHLSDTVNMLIFVAGGGYWVVNILLNCLKSLIVGSNEFIFSIPCSSFVQVTF